MLLVACSPSTRPDQFEEALLSSGSVGVAVVVQQGDCESRSTELRMLASRLPNVAIVLLRTRGAAESTWEQTVREIFPESKHRYHVTSNGARLVKLGVSATPAVLQWSGEAPQLRGTPLSLDRPKLISQIRALQAGDELAP